MAYQIYTFSLKCLFVCLNVCPFLFVSEPSVPSSSIHKSEEVLWIIFLFWTLRSRGKFCCFILSNGNYFHGSERKGARLSRLLYRIQLPFTPLHTWWLNMRLGMYTQGALLYSVQTQMFGKLWQTYIAYFGDTHLDKFS